MLEFAPAPATEMADDERFERRAFVEESRGHEFIVIDQGVFSEMFSSHSFAGALELGDTVRAF